MTIVRRIVEMHGGSVLVDSPGKNQGSEFVVRLPMSTNGVARGPATTQTADDRPPNDAGHRIMIVDDNGDSAATLSALLTSIGHDVQVFLDGRKALEAVQEFQPALVLLDIGLPGMDGYKVAAMLRNTPGLERMILAAVTGYGQEEDRRRSTEAGFDCHLVKPVELAALQSLIETLHQRATGAVEARLKG